MDNKQQKKALEHYSEQLAHLIVSMSTYYEGVTPSIDKEIKKLRKQLKGNPNFSSVEKSINKVLPLLVDSDQLIRHQLSGNVQNLQTRLKTIQQYENNNQAFSQALIRLQRNLAMPTNHLGELHGHFFKVVGLLEALLDNNDKDKNIPHNDYQNQAFPTITATAMPRADGLKAEIVAELIQLIDVYASKKTQDSELLNIKVALEQDIDDTQLLESCLIVIRHIVSDAMLEASASGKIVQNFALEIGKTHESVDQSISLSHQHFQKQNEYQASFQDSLFQLNQEIDDSQDLNKLKSQAQRHIEKMQQDIENQRVSDAEEQKALMELLESMQQQLHSLQRKTQSYKRRLVEQRASVYTDPLTRIPNRLAYNERVAKSLRLVKASKEPLSLAIMDIDHFKTINDQYGHAAGDRTLQAIAKHVQKSLQPNEFFARWGGEEFVLLMQNQGQDSLAERLEKIRFSLSELPFKFKQTPVKITASFGACSIKGNETPQLFFERADTALYAAKSLGRNRVVVAQE